MHVRVHFGWVEFFVDMLGVGGAHELQDRELNWHGGQLEMLCCSAGAAVCGGGAGHQGGDRYFHLPGQGEVGSKVASSLRSA